MFTKKYSNVTDDATLHKLIQKTPKRLPYCSPLPMKCLFLPIPGIDRLLIAR